MGSPKVAVLGGAGMLGAEVVALLGGEGYEVKALDLPAFDITRREDLKGALDSADAVVNCAAFTDVEGAEDRQGAAYAVNAAAAGELGNLARERGIFVLHISTEFVFDGSAAEPYTEESAPNPINVYGASKLKGEEELSESGCEHCIMRVQWSYGSNGRNFISKILERLEQTNELTVVEDQVGAPTWTRDMSRAVACILRRRATGLLHFANTGYASRYQVACFVTRQMGIEAEISPCSSSQFPTKAKRPKNSRFNVDRIRNNVLDHGIRDWRSALAEYLKG